MKRTTESLVISAQDQVLAIKSVKYEIVKFLIPRNADSVKRVKNLTHLLSRCRIFIGFYDVNTNRGTENWHEHVTH